MGSRVVDRRACQWPRRRSRGCGCRVSSSRRHGLGRVLESVGAHFRTADPCASSAPPNLVSRRIAAQQAVVELTCRLADQQHVKLERLRRGYPALAGKHHHDARVLTGPIPAGMWTRSRSGRRLAVSTAALGLGDRLGQRELAPQWARPADQEAGPMALRTWQPELADDNEANPPVMNACLDGRFASGGNPSAALRAAPDMAV